MSLDKAGEIAAAGMHVQTVRLRVIAENMSNADSTAKEPGGEPYRRKVVSFRAIFDRELGATSVRATRIGPAAGDFGRSYDPSHPAADRDGYVLTPNVNGLIEMTDMREAQRSYQANLNVTEAVDTMRGRLVNVLDTL